MKARTKVNRKEFIKKLVVLYEDFTEKNIKARKEAYELVLEEKMEYGELYIKLLKKYESFKFAPTPATILKIMNENDYVENMQRMYEYVN